MPGVCLLGPLVDVLFLHQRVAVNSTPQVRGSSLLQLVNCYMLILQVVTVLAAFLAKIESLTLLFYCQ